jgi:hypothetical protein
LSFSSPRPREQEIASASARLPPKKSCLVCGLTAKPREIGQFWLYLPLDQSAS